MKKHGREMRSFLIRTSAIVALIISLTVAVMTIDSVRRIDREASDAKGKVTEQLKEFLESTIDNAPEMGRDRAIVEAVKTEVVEKLMMGDLQPMMSFQASLIRLVYGAEYAVYIIEGKPAAESVKSEYLDEKIEFPSELPAPELYVEELDVFMGEDGYFVSLFAETAFPQIKGSQFINVIIDRTKQMQQLDDFYSNEKRSLIIRQVLGGVIVIALSLLICFFAVKHYARRFITGPIENFAEVSHQIMDGSFDGFVEVDEESDYADIQRLLASGKMLIDRATCVDDEDA